VIARAVCEGAARYGAPVGARGRRRLRGGGWAAGLGDRESSRSLSSRRDGARQIRGAFIRRPSLPGLGNRRKFPQGWRTTPPPPPPPPPFATGMEKTEMQLRDLRAAYHERLGTKVVWARGVAGFSGDREGAFSGASRATRVRIRELRGAEAAFALARARSGADPGP